MLDSFRATEGRYPRPYSREDALKFVELAKTLNASLECKVSSVIYQYLYDRLLSATDRLLSIPDRLLSFSSMVPEDALKFVELAKTLNASLECKVSSVIYRYLYDRLLSATDRLLSILDRLLSFSSMVPEDALKFVELAKTLNASLECKVSSVIYRYLLSLYTLMTTTVAIKQFLSF